MSTVTNPPAPSALPAPASGRPVAPGATGPSAGRQAEAGAGAWSLANTPGWYRLVATVIVAVVIGFAALATTATFITRSSSRAIQSNTAPSLIAVQGLSASVAEANAAATAVFLSGTTGTEDRTRRVQYLNALERSAEQTEQVAGLVGDDSSSHEALQAVSVALTTYSGEIEASRTANALDESGADETLRSALDLTRGQIAAAVGTVTDQNQQRFDDEAETGVLLTIGALVLGVVAIIALGWFQQGVFRRSNRLLNIGLLAATVLLVAAVATIASNVVIRGLALDNAEQGGYDAIAATSRLQASANELQTQLSLRLLGGGAGDVETLINELDSGVSGIAADADSTRERAAAKELAIRWARYRETAESITTLSDQDSTDQAITEFQGEGLSRFNGLNTSIESVLSDNRAQFTDGVEAAADAVDLLPLFSLVLPALAVVGVVLGVQRRLQDYQ